MQQTLNSILSHETRGGVDNPGGDKACNIYKDSIVLLLRLLPYNKWTKFVNSGHSDNQGYFYDIYIIVHYYLYDILTFKPRPFKFLLQKRRTNGASKCQPDELKIQSYNCDDYLHHWRLASSCLESRVYQESRAFYLGD